MVNNEPLSQKEILDERQKITRQKITLQATDPLEACFIYLNIQVNNGRNTVIHNKNWNFYEGMTPEQLEEQIRLDQVGHRPTWHVHDLYANAMKDPLDILGLSRGRNKGRKNPDIDDFESYEIVALR